MTLLSEKLVTEQLQICFPGAYLFINAQPCCECLTAGEFALKFLNIA